MIKIIKLAILGFLTAALITSCETDPAGGGTTPGGSGGGNEDAPTIALVDAAGLVTTSATVAPGATFSVRIQAAKGAADLQGIFFDVDGADFPFSDSRITVDGNPGPMPGDGLAVLASETSSLSWDVSIIAHAEETTTKIYSFTVRDVAGLVDQVDVNITTSVAGGGTGPTTSGLVEAAGFINAAATVDPGTTFKVRLTATAGDDLLDGVFFDVDGAEMPDAVNRVDINGIDINSSGVAVDDSEQESFTWDLDIIAHNEANVTKVYEFVIRDVAGDLTTVSLPITTTGTGGVTAPTIMIPMSTVAVGPNSLLSIPIDITAGSPGLSSIGVIEVRDPDPVIVNPSRLSLGGLAFSDNPQILDAADIQGFNKNLEIRSHTDEALVDYIIVFTDQDNNQYLHEFSIDTRVQGNPLESRQGVLFNKAGPAGRGGLDLDSGAGTGSSDPSAELKDNGIDQSQPNANNWLQTITGVNGTVLKYLIPNQNGLSGDFAYENISTDAELATLWGSGVDLNVFNSDGESSTAAINVGDTFIANKGGTYYMFIIREVNVTATDNDDNYVLDIVF